MVIMAVFVDSATLFLFPQLYAVALYWGRPFSEFLLAIFGCCVVVVGFCGLFGAFSAVFSWVSDKFSGFSSLVISFVGSAAVLVVLVLWLTFGFVIGFVDVAGLVCGLVSPSIWTYSIVGCSASSLSK
jgi:hypothetical protein